MSDEEDQTGAASVIAGMMAGLQLAFAVLVNELDAQKLLSREDAISAFRLTAKQLPETVKQRAMMALMLERIAGSIEHTHRGAADPGQRLN